MHVIARLSTKRGPFAQNTHHSLLKYQGVRYFRSRSEARSNTIFAVVLGIFSGYCLLHVNIIVFSPPPFTNSNLFHSFVDAFYRLYDIQSTFRNDYDEPRKQKGQRRVFHVKA